MVHPKLLAQTPVDLGTFKGIGPLGEPTATQTDPGISAFTKIISNAIGVMTVIGFIWFLFTFLTGAISWLGAGGDKQKIENSQKTITNGLIGLIVVISAIFLTKLFGSLLGVDILSLEVITKLWQ